MSNYRRVTRLGAIAAVGALALAACSSTSTPATSGSPSASAASGYNAAIDAIVNPSTATGGTLKLAAQGDCDAWDPARTYYAYCWDLQRLFTRTLMGLAGVAGPGGAKAVPDLATAPGSASADKKTWTYHLQAGLKFQDGTTITSKDIKYGLERLFATDIINGGPSQYFLCLLSTCDATGAPAYKGPYKDPTGDLPAITTPDDTTIVFALNKPFADFDFLMTLPTAAPIEKSKDLGAKYTTAVQSTGPFEFKSYNPSTGIVWVRNPNWVQSTDTIRHPLVNEIDLTFTSDPAVSDKQLAAGTLDLEADGGVQATFMAQIATGTTFKANADDPTTGFTRYFAIMPSVIPNIDCRKAIFLAINKADLVKARGGIYGGDPATTMTPPTIPGYVKGYDPYPTGADFTGDVAGAKAELVKCGQPNGFTTNMAFVNKGRGPAIFLAVQQALARVGIKVVSAPGDSATYYSNYIGSPANIVAKKLGIALAGWAADFPTGYGFWESIADGTTILPNGNTDYPSLNDPTINGLLKNSTSADVAAQQGIFEQVDHAVMDQAVYLPFQYDKSLYYRNPRLTNIYLQAGLGNYYDYVNVGVGGGS
jgi:peptide/nickel transport system substrate-binding protein